MRDPEAELRRLVLRSSRPAWTEKGELPRIVWIAGALPRVGATTIAVDVAQTLASGGFRIVLINATSRSQYFAQLTGSEPVDDPWLMHRTEIHEVLQRGFAGLQIVTGLGEVPTESRRSELRQWLHRQICTLRPHADVVLMVGSFNRAAWSSELADWSSDLVLVSSLAESSLNQTAVHLQEYERRLEAKRVGIVFNRVELSSDEEAAWSTLRSQCSSLLADDCQRLGVLPLIDSMMGADKILGAEQVLNAAQGTERLRREAKWQSSIHRLAAELMEGQWQAASKAIA